VSRPVALLVAAAVLATGVLVSGCDDTNTFVDNRQGQSVDVPTAGWSAVKPIAVHLPTDDPINAGSVPDDSVPTVVNLWASWCVPCKKELPLLEKVARTGKLHVIGFSRDNSESNAAAALARAEVTYPNWMDTDLSLIVALDRRVPFGSVPSSVLIRDGKVVASHIGEFTSEAEVLAALEIT
jgi:thiol-disulfide isomerase/thioredoxin